ncbi:glycosyl hydrolase [Wenyingzhuangia sp. 1_MG-2023]|nr:glycosyl hydrolase [Wenyingzhuangia sp. 1_MG-2023]
MRVKITFIITLLFTLHYYAQTAPCGSIINDIFDVSGSLPTEWTEYNTSGRVTIEDGNLKLDHNTLKPSVYRTFTAVTDNFSYAFDVSSTRNYVNCTMSLISSTGTHLASLSFGSSGKKNIVYASNMDGGEPSEFIGSLIPGNYASNTVYSIAMDVDFANQQINMYNEGNLMATNVPFLETAQDIAKIDIELQYMYNNEGRFFFDNISLISTSQNRLDFTKLVTASETILSTAIIGDVYNQYPQSAYDVFESAVNNAQTFLTNCEASTSEIDQSYSDFILAKTTFENTRVNNPVLKLYSGLGFSGEEHKVYCGYYNGGLGAYEDWAVSFTLEKGYMATFAEDINGLGVSKVYIAQDNDLEINLPENLQNKISFIRVSPWSNIRKKGIGAKGDDVVASLNTSWNYNWGTTGEYIGDSEFVPNQWGGGSVTKAISLGERMDLTHYMAFNEPDNEDQSNMTVDRAIEKYPELLASGLRLGSPAVTDGSRGATWRNEFMAKAVENGLRVDYIVVHYYKKTSPTAFYNWLKAIHDKWGLPIWIKEFNYGATWTAQPASNEAASDGLESYINMLDDASFVERYAVFTWQPDKPIYSLMSVRNPITLSSSGNMYRDHESPVAYTQEVYEQGGQLSSDKNSIATNILIYPTVINDGIVNIAYSNGFKNSNLEFTIYSSTTGQLVQKSSGLKTEIDVGTLSSGVYIIKITAASGFFTKKIIIQ